MPTQVDTRDHSAIPILVEVQWFFRPEDTGLPAKVRQTVAHNEVRDSGLQGMTRDDRGDKG